MALLLATCLWSPPSATAAFEDVFAPEGPESLYPTRADGRRQDRPELRAYRLEPGERIAVDGRLDDDAWRRAENGHGLVQHEPERRAIASVPTIFKIAYDDQALYLAAACWENDMADVSRRLSRRDTIEGCDFVSFYLDPYHDHLSGYNFRITADGVKADHYLFEDTGRDADWDAVWEAETWQDARGWYLELRIPLAVMRFRTGGSDTWGMQFYRWLHGRGEDTGWATSDRNEPGFVSRWGTLSGMGRAASPRRLEILPYMAAGLEDRALPEVDREELGRYLNWGTDFKLNITSALTAQATFQPDFGQVEADPALLNLSPFETFFAEQRPFFVEGARFFEHPDFRLFYSRRIGTGEPGSRIRGAAKLTGKLDGQTSIAVLGAVTDVAHPEQLHNPFAQGHRRKAHAVVRSTREFAGGNHRVGLMATSVWQQPTDHGPDNGDRDHRDAYSLGTDWELNLADRRYQIEGSVVATYLDPHDGLATNGTAGALSLRKNGGRWRGGVDGAWEHDRFDPNDIGFLSANDETYTAAWLQRRHDDDGSGSRFKSMATYARIYRSWLYGDQRRVDAVSGTELWSYGKGHPQGTDLYVENWLQTHGYHEFVVSASHDFGGTSKYETRWFDGHRGPLMSTPSSSEIRLYTQSDWRRDQRHSAELEHDWSEVGEQKWELSYGLRADLGRHLQTRLSLGYETEHNDAHWLTNEAFAGGLGGVAYVFAELDQQTLDATLRASWIWNRDTSLELYMQPYLTSGEYRNPRILTRPDSRDLAPYDLDAAARDFTFAALNLNLVWRWEYAPGSTVHLVWTHGREHFDRRDRYSEPGLFDDSLRPGLLFDQEPRSTILLKIDHWFAL